MAFFVKVYLYIQLPHNRWLLTGPLEWSKEYDCLFYSNLHHNLGWFNGLFITRHKCNPSSQVTTGGSPLHNQIFTYPQAEYINTATK